MQSLMACIQDRHTLQHTATHCNTLQHTATHCNTLQHTATHYSTLQHTATHCSTLQHTATHKNRRAVVCVYMSATHYNSLYLQQVACVYMSATRCNTLQHTATCCAHTAVCCCVLLCVADKYINKLHRHSEWEWGCTGLQEFIGSLIFIGHFPQK